MGKWWYCSPRRGLGSELPSLALNVVCADCQCFTRLLALNREIVLLRRSHWPSVWSSDRPGRTVKDIIAVRANLSSFVVAGIGLTATTHRIGSSAVRSFELLRTDTAPKYEQTGHAR